MTPNTTRTLRYTLLGACLAAGALAAWVAQAQPDLASITPKVVPIATQTVERVGQQSGLTNCFWQATVSPSTFNILIPDSGVVYWLAQYRLPAGAKLALQGQFPHARHMSFNTYDASGQPADRINDVMLQPDAQGTNPFQPGARRDTIARGYRVSLEDADVVAGVRVDDAKRPANTLFAPQGTTVQLWYRVYVPDQGADVRGAVALPQPVLTRADGSVARGDAVCPEVVVKEGAVRDVKVAPAALKAMAAMPGATSPHHPAQNPPQWHAFFNGPLSMSNVLVGTPFEGLRARMDATRRGGFYSTLDNTYMSMFVDARFGDVLVISGTAPTTPRTHGGASIMSSGQLRYWSLCKYRSLADTAVDDCVYDEQVPLDAQGRYTIVVSHADQRPANATPACGVAWLNWGVGDGIDNPDGGFLAIRHMLPAPDFNHSLFATRKPGDEMAALGDYYPVAKYQSKGDFEGRGCTGQRGG